MGMSVPSITPVLTATSPATVPLRASESTVQEARPQERVDPVDPTQLPAPIKGLGIAPLDMFQVGDNDYVPLPPDPPRDPIAMVAPLEFGEDRPAQGPVAINADADTATGTGTGTGIDTDTRAVATRTEAPVEPQRETAPDLARALKALDMDARAPSIDIRS